MKHTIFVIMVLVLSSAVLPAFSADIVHDFRSATGRSFSDDFKSCTISLSSGTYTYTCGSNSSMGADPSSQISVALTHSGDYVTLSPAMGDLSEFVINFTSNTKNTANYTNIKIYISEDGSTWGNPLPANRVNYASAGTVKAIIPKGTWFIKVLNTNGSKPVYITTLRYTPVNCNCNTYIPE